MSHESSEPTDCDDATLQMFAENLELIHNWPETEIALQSRLRSITRKEASLSRALRLITNRKERRFLREELRELRERNVAEQADIAAALRDLHAIRRRLEPLEIAYVGRYEAYIYREPDPPKLPTLIEPGPDKVEVFTRRLANGHSLWHEQDTPLAPSELCEYDPVQATGNFATVGRAARRLLLEVFFPDWIGPPEKGVA